MQQNKGFQRVLGGCFHPTNPFIGILRYKLFASIACSIMAHEFYPIVSYIVCIYNGGMCLCIYSLFSARFDEFLR